jgi:hypothetical protein
MYTQREAMVAQLALEKQHLTAFPQEARVPAGGSHHQWLSARASPRPASFWPARRVR